MPPIVDEVLRSPGQPLDSHTRAFMEPRFGHDFSQVRVRTGAKAAESARVVDALAYTVGSDIVFAKDGYQPKSKIGLKLIAHELSHVVQQNCGGNRDIESDHALEQQAEAAATNVVAGRSATLMGSGGVRLMPQTPGAQANQIARRPVQYKYKMAGYVPSTKIGRFNEVEYNSETQILTITIRPHFEFVGMDVNQYPPEVRNNPEARARAEGQIRLQKNAFIRSFVMQAEGWGGHHTFVCQEPGLESLRASVRVEVDLTPDTPGASSDYTHVRVTDSDKRDITGGHTATMQVGLQSGLGVSQYDATKNAMLPTSVGPPVDLRQTGERGSAPDGLPGLREPVAAKVNDQYVLMHEMGHVFGLGDEYVEAGKPSSAKGSPTEHSALAKSMLGKTVTRGSDSRSIMATGNDILPEHGVTFLDALQKVTKMAWGFSRANRDSE